MSQIPQNNDIGFDSVTERSMKEVRTEVSHEKDTEIRLLGYIKRKKETSVSQ